MKRREIQVFSLSFLDLISGALGAVIILYVAVPKGPVPNPNTPVIEVEKTSINESELKAQIRDLQSEIKRTILENEDLKSQINKMDIETPKTASGGSEYDVGFKFKGKHIVFLLDTSLSMYEDDRIGQVKAGLKMLLTSMPPNYKVDLVAFPNGQVAPFRSLWGTTKPINLEQKNIIFDFLYNLRPLGGTPTRDALTYILNNYTDASDIVLLTDGEPSLHNSATKDDVYDILSQVMKLNQNKIQISTIGVGQEMMQDHQSAPYQFLKLLAEQNGGFFVEF